MPMTAAVSATCLWYVRTFWDDVRKVSDHRTIDYSKHFRSEQIQNAMSDRAIEWFSALVMLGWGMVLGLPGDTMVGTNWQAFHRLGATESFWAAMFGTIGAARLVALYINGKWPRTPIVRMLGSLFGAISWGQVCFLLTQGALETTGNPSTGTIVYGLLALADLFSIFRASFDARYYAR